MYAQDPTQRLGQPQAQQPAVSTDQGNWGIWIINSDRFANQPGSYSRSETPPFYRFPSREAAEQWIEQQRAARPNMRTDIEVREIEPAAQALNRNTLAPTGPGPWEVFRRSDGSSVAELGQTNRMAAEVEARRVIDQRREAPELYGVRTATAGTDNWSGDFERRMQPGQYQYTSTPIPGVQDVELDIPFAPQTLTRPGQDQQTFTGEWRVMVDGEEVYRFSGVGNNQGDANRVGQNWILQQIRQGTLTPVEGVDVEVLPVMR
jgi:hypothetical protein